MIYWLFVRSAATAMAADCYQPWQPIKMAIQRSLRLFVAQTGEDN